MRELWPKNEIRKNSRNRLCTSGKLIYGSATSKIGFCLKNWPRDMCVVPILSIEAEIMGGEEILPPPRENRRSRYTGRIGLSLYRANELSSASGGKDTTNEGRM